VQCCGCPGKILAQSETYFCPGHSGFFDLNNLGLNSLSKAADNSF